MIPNRHRRTLTAALIPVLSACVSAQGATAQALVYGDTIVEVLGLRTWTPDKLEQAVKRFVPDMTLASAACAVILRDSLGFADAAVMTYSFSGRDTVWTAIRVVEPADSSLVRYDTHHREQIPIPPEWAELNAEFEQNPRMVSFFQHTEFLLGDADSVFGRPVPQEARVLRAALRRYNSPRDHELALSILRQSSRSGARQLAALVITNFAAAESTWYALVQSIRAGSDVGSSASQLVLAAMARSGRYTIDWAPAAEALQAIVAGTNLFAYDGTLGVLLDTGIEPTLARHLARSNPELMADHAVALNRSVRLLVRRYLEHAGAPDLGMSRDGWLRWLKS